MKHLTKYNESDAFTHDPEMNLIKEIILELKHEFPSLEGKIVNRKISNNDVFTVIQLSPLPIYNEGCVKLFNIEKKMNYFNTIIECCKRLEDALDRRVVIENLFEINKDRKSYTINIVIDDTKNKGVKWV